MTTVCPITNGQDLSIDRYICTQRLKREAARKALTIVDQRTLATDAGVYEHVELLSSATVTLQDVHEQLNDPADRGLTMSAEAVVDSSNLRSAISLFEENAQLKRQLTALRNTQVSNSSTPSSLPQDDLSPTILSNTFSTFYFSPGDMNALDQIRFNYTRELLQSITDQFTTLVFTNAQVVLSMAKLNRQTREAEFRISYTFNPEVLRPFLTEHFDTVEINAPQHAVFLYPRETQISKDMFNLLKQIRLLIHVQFAGGHFDVPITLPGSLFSKSCGPSPRNESSGYCLLLSLDKKNQQSEHLFIMRGIDFNNPTVLSYSLQLL